MPASAWFLIAVAIGAVLLVGATLLDARSRRRVTGRGEPAPARGVEEVDRHAPAYLTQDEVDATRHPAEGRGGSLPHRGEGFGFGHAHPDFATVPDGASWDGPWIAVVDGEVRSMRELMGLLGLASADTPLVVVAEAFHKDVLRTLAANRRTLDLPVVAAAAPRRDRLRLAELSGGEFLTVADLQAGYVPDSALGRASHWSSTLKRCWVEPQPAT